MRYIKYLKIIHNCCRLEPCKSATIDDRRSTIYDWRLTGLGWARETVLLVARCENRRVERYKMQDTRYSSIERGVVAAAAAAAGAGGCLSLTGRDEDVARHGWGRQWLRQTRLTTKNGTKEAEDDQWSQSSPSPARPGTPLRPGWRVSGVEL